jgi:hypothetical protein
VGLLRTDHAKSSDTAAFINISANANTNASINTNINTNNAGADAVRLAEKGYACNARDIADTDSADSNHAPVAGHPSAGTG